MNKAQKHVLSQRNLGPFKWAIGLVFMMFLPIEFLGQTLKDSTDVTTEVVEVVKSYTPSVNLRLKAKWDFLDQNFQQRETPLFEYMHQNPVLTPSDLPPGWRPLKQVKEQTPKTLPNYFRAWLGTRSAAGLEGFVSRELDNKNYLNFLFDHQQINGAIQDVTLPPDWAESRVSAHWRSKLKRRSSVLELSYQRSALEWYGIPTNLNLDPSASYDFGQTYHKTILGHQLGSNKGWFTGMNSEFSMFSDRLGVSEFKFSVAPKAEFNWNKRLIALSGNVAYLNTTYDLSNTLISTENYSALNADIKGQVDVNLDVLAINLGVQLWAHNGSVDNTFRLFPNIELSYPLLGPKLAAHMRFSGQYQQNELSLLTDIQAFLAPGAPLAPQIDQQILSFGFSGLFGDLWQYNLSAEFRNFENQAYITRRPWSGLQSSFAYDNGNSFVVNYDRGIEWSVAVKINGRLTDQWDIALHGRFVDNRPSDNAEPWNIPRISFGGSGTYHISEQLLLTTQFLGYGSRKDQVIIGDQVIVQEVKGFIDAQVQLNYALTKNFSASMSGINLLNQSNGLWFNYPVQGIRVNLGLQYNFGRF